MSYWTGARVLVTGGASFIGSHLVEELLDRQAEVRVADDLSSGRLENLGTSRERVDLRIGDLRDRTFTQEAMRDIDVVFHLAACHGGRGFIDTHPVECASNLVLDGIVFEEAWRGRVDRVCFASSACVYPVQRQKPAADGNLVYLKEDEADPFAPGGAAADGEYGWAKLMGEMALGAYAKQHGMKSAVCRLFTAYGERENETHAVIALIAKALVGTEPFEIWGNGQQDRNFTYVGDIVLGMLLAAERIEDASAVNIGTAEHVKIIDLARMIFEHTGFRPERIHFDLDRPVGVFSRAADLTKARDVLGFEPQTSLALGLARTIDWYRATHDRDEVARRLDVLLTER